MAAPSINESPGFEVIASGVPYVKTFTATNTPTAWELTGVPSGIVINSSGVSSGAGTVTAATSYTFSLRAQNGDGWSTAKTWLVVVTPYAVGGPSNAFTRALDLDINFGTLQVPGVGSPLPRGRGTSPAVLLEAETEFTDETEYLTRWTTGDRFALSLGAMSGGVLQDLDISKIYATLRESEDAPGITIGEDDLTPTGSDTTARFETTIHLDRDLLDPIVGGFEAALRTVAPMLLGLTIEVPDDDRDFSATDSEAIPTLTQSDSDVDTMTATITAERAAATLYDVTVTLVCPTDTALNVTLVRRISLTYAGATYVLGTATGETVGTGNATDSRDWDVTLEITDLTATGTGISVETTVTTTAQSSTIDSVGCVIEGPINSFTTDGATISHATSFNVEFNDGTSTIIGSAVTISDGDTEADVLAAVEAATGEEVTSVVFDDAATDTITVNFAAGSIVEEVYFPALVTTGSTTVNTHSVPSYSNATVAILVEGVEMPENSKTITSAAVAVLIERKMTR